jgi:hypothetical protein
VILQSVNQRGEVTRSLDAIIQVGDDEIEHLLLSSTTEYTEAARRHVLKGLIFSKGISFPVLPAEPLFLSQFKEKDLINKCRQKKTPIRVL